MGKKKRTRNRREGMAEVWEDQPHRARPTTERLKRGSFVIRDTDRAGVTVAVDEHATELDRLYAAEVIDADQRQGGLDFADLMRRTRLTSEGRSCIDFSPVGHDPEEYDDTQERQDSKARQDLYAVVGPRTWHILRRVCIEDSRHANAVRLREGLDRCAEYFGRKRK